MIQNINSPRVEIQDHGRLTKNSTRVHGLTPKQNNKTSISTPKITTFNRSQNHEGVQTRILTLNKCGILAKPNHNHPNSMSPKDTTPEGDKLPDGVGKQNTKHNSQPKTVKDNKLWSHIPLSILSKTDTHNKQPTATVQLGDSNMLATKQLTANNGDKTPHPTGNMTQFVKNDPREKSSIPSPNTIQSTFNHSEIVEDTDADMEAEEERLLNGSQTSNANHEQRGSVTFDEKGNVTAHARHFLLVESIIQGITQHHVILIEHKKCNPFVLCRPMRDRNFRLCPITIPQIEEEKPVEESPPTLEMAGCRINPAAADSGSRPNPAEGQC